MVRFLCLFVVLAAVRIQLSALEEKRVISSSKILLKASRLNLPLLATQQQTYSKFSCPKVKATVQMRDKGRVYKKMWELSDLVGT